MQLIPAVDEAVCPPLHDEQKSVRLKGSENSGGTIAARPSKYVEKLFFESKHRWGRGFENNRCLRTDSNRQ